VFGNIAIKDAITVGNSYRFWPIENHLIVLAANINFVVAVDLGRNQTLQPRYNLFAESIEIRDCVDPPEKLQNFLEIAMF